MRHLFFAQFIILYIISTGLAGCGYKGPPKPPTIPLEEIPLEEIPLEEIPLEETKV